MPTYTETAVKGYIDTRLSAATSYADTAKAALTTYLTDLSTQITSFTGAEIDFSGITFPSNYTPSITVAAAPSAPSVPSITTPVIPDAPLLNIPEAAFGKVPVAPGISVYFEENQELSETHSSFVTSLKSALINSKILSASAEQALYDRAQNRLNAQNAKLEEDAIAFWAARGHELPQGPLVALIAQQQVEQARNLLEINAEILAKSGEFAIQATSAIMQAAVAYEGMWVQHQDALNERHLKSVVESARASLESYAAKVQGFSSSVQAEAARLNVLVDAEKIKAALYDSTLKGLSLKTETEIVAAKAVIDIYVSQLQGYSSEVQAKGFIEQLKLSGTEVASKNAGVQKDLILKDAELRIKEASNLLSLQVEALKGGAQVQAQIVASALSSVNTSASYGFSGGWNDNYSTDLSKGTVSESIVHNLSE